MLDLSPSVKGATGKTAVSTWRQIDEERVQRGQLEEEGA
jgi:hypothetical protein